MITRRSENNSLTTRRIYNHEYNESPITEIGDFFLSSISDIRGITGITILNVAGVGLRFIDQTSLINTILLSSAISVGGFIALSLNPYKCIPCGVTIVAGTVLLFDIYCCATATYNSVFTVGEKINGAVNDVSNSVFMVGAKINGAVNDASNSVFMVGAKINGAVNDASNSVFMVGAKINGAVTHASNLMNPMNVSLVIGVAVLLYNSNNLGDLFKCFQPVFNMLYKCFQPAKQPTIDDLEKAKDKILGFINHINFSQDRKEGAWKMVSKSEDIKEFNISQEDLKEIFDQVWQDTHPALEIDDMSVLGDL